MQPDLKESASRKSILRKFCERLEGAGRYFEGLNGTVFTLYATFVFSVDAIASDYFSPKFIPAAIFFIATTAAAVCPAIIRFFSKNSIAENSFAKKKLAKNGMKKQLAATRKPAKHVSDKQQKSYFASMRTDRLPDSLPNSRLCCKPGLRPCRLLQCPARFALYAIVFAILLFYFIAYYPGSFSDDSINQYEQAESNRYSDWHPAIHTLLAFKLPLVLSAGRADSIVLFQIICFSAALGYAFSAILKHAGAKYAAVSAGFVLLNPQTGYIMLFPWKDNAFATGAVLLSAYCLRIFFTKGQWLEKTANAAAFAVAACLTTLFRHNAILFTGPLIFAVIFCILRNNMLTSPPKDEKESNAGSRRKICALKNIAAGNIAVKNTAIICISIFAICLSITGPLYSALGVENPGQRQVETLGLPMNVIGAAVTYTPNALDEQTREFAYKVAPREVWEEKYVCGSYNPVKWDSRTNNDIIEEYGSQRVVSMMFRAMKSSKKATAKALIKLTEAAYTVTDDYDDFIKPHISKNDFGLSQKNTGKTAEICEGYRNFVRKYLSYPFLHLGFAHMLLIIAVLSRCKLARAKDWERIFFVLPVFVYDFGTTFLLTGVDDASRFFYYAFAILPILLIFPFSGRNA